MEGGMLCLIVVEGGDAVCNNLAGGLDLTRGDLRGLAFMLEVEGTLGISLTHDERGAGRMVEAWCCAGADGRVAWRPRLGEEGRGGAGEREHALVCEAGIKSTQGGWVSALRTALSGGSRAHCTRGEAEAAVGSRSGEGSGSRTAREMSRSGQDREGISTQAAGTVCGGGAWGLSRLTTTAHERWLGGWSRGREGCVRSRLGRAPGAENWDRARVRGHVGADDA